MDLLSLLATVILFTTVGTLMMALAAYIAYKLRDKRKPAKKKRAENTEEQPTMFLEQFLPPGTLSSARQPSPSKDIQSRH